MNPQTEPIYIWRQMGDGVRRVNVIPRAAGPENFAAADVGKRICPVCKGVWPFFGIHACSGPSK